MQPVTEVKRNSSCLVLGRCTLQQSFFVQSCSLHTVFQSFWEFKLTAFHVNVSSTNHLATAGPKCVSVVCCHPMIQPLKES